MDRQSKRPHRELPSSELVVVRGMAHMIQHLALRKVVATIDRAAEQSREAA